MSDNQVIPEAAVEAAFRALFPNDPDANASTSSFWAPTINTILEAAAPHMLSHEREQTRLAHLDAVVNAQTADRLQSELDSLRAAWTEQWDAERGGR